MMETTSNKNNLILDGVCGFLFAAAWWVFVDGMAAAHGGPGYLYAPGILATIGFFLLANLPTTMFQKSQWGEETEWWLKAILLLAVVCEFGGIVTSIWLFAEKTGDREGSVNTWRGASSIVQPVVITLASFMWNFLYKDPEAY